MPREVTYELVPPADFSAHRAWDLPVNSQLDTQFGVTGGIKFLSVPTRFCHDGSIRLVGVYAIEAVVFFPYLTVWDFPLPRAGPPVRS